MSQTLFDVAVLVFAAGLVGFGFGCLVARLLASGARQSGPAQPGGGHGASAEAAAPAGATEEPPAPESPPPQAEERNPTGG